MHESWRELQHMRGNWLFIPAGGDWGETLHMKILWWFSDPQHCVLQRSSKAAALWRPRTDKAELLSRARRESPTAFANPHCSKAHKSGVFRQLHLRSFQFWNKVQMPRLLYLSWLMALNAKQKRMLILLDIICIFTKHKMIQICFEALADGTG